MGTVELHLAFMAVAALVVLFLLLMRARLRAQYPDDTSKQMRSMLGFMRGMAIFAALVLAIVALDLARVLAG